MELAELLRRGLSRATATGVLGVKPTHLTSAETDELLELCLDFLWDRRTEPSHIEGWWLSAGGIRPWWEKEAKLSDREALSLRSLRTAVYDLLEDRGAIVKGPGNVVPIHVSPPDRRPTLNSDTEVITLNASGAGYGTPEANKKVELAAMTAVADHYTEHGWTINDVSLQKVGWDITVRRGDDELHLEVKGVSGSKPVILLTRNEHSKAGSDPLWRLAIVTQALSNPVLKEYEASVVLAASSPHVFRAQFPVTAGG